MKKRLPLAHCLSLAALLGLTGTASFAQSGSATPAMPANIQELIKQAQELKGPNGDVAKGWTCRDPQDGKRMHVMDTTGIARMNSIPSSIQGFQDTTTPAERLPTCARPQ